MAGSGADAKGGARQPTFLLVFDAPTTADAVSHHQHLVVEFGAALRPILGFSPRVAAAYLPPASQRWTAEETRALGQAIETRAEDTGVLFLLPVSFDFDLDRKALLTAAVREARRRHAGLEVYYDDVEPAHPLLVQALVDSSCRALSGASCSPNDLGMLLVASGVGDAGTRAESYRLMRLVWEQLGVKHAEVAFVRHPTWPLPEQLARCAARGSHWLILPQYLGPSEHLEYAGTLIADFAQREPQAATWSVAAPLTKHPAVTAWLVQRALALHRSERGKHEGRQRSRRDGPPRPSRLYGPGESMALDELSGVSAAAPSYSGTLLADLGDSGDLKRLLALRGVSGERCLVKVTWHGYATGTYTDPAALDALLQALPGNAIILEGHTTSRNRGGAAFDWESEARQHRDWIQREETEYLERTGLAAVMRRHRASYVNVTEAFWDGACAPREQVEALLLERGVHLTHPELAEFVPEVLFKLRGAPCISFARFKGPTRLCVANLFGLLPPPFRDAWHGPNITYFARVCCDLAKLYGALFQPFGLAESLTSAVHWDRKGLYRSRWGNYDLIPSPGIVCLGSSLASVDALAARLQGQDIRGSAFFDVVTAELGIPSELATAPIDDALVARFA